VRIQTERGHTVISGGPYRFVRHPGYAGVILSWIVSPVFFSSTWAAIPAFVAILLVVIRTSLEDRTLQAELPGYREYAQIVRYRLAPGIW
jgi:protein-S-isoprenylcysteine O-methyltransferase Ste14